MSNFLSQPKDSHQPANNKKSVDQVSIDPNSFLQQITQHLKNIEVNSQNDFGKGEVQYQDIKANEAERGLNVVIW